MPDRPIRTFMSGQDACPLMNRGKAWLRTVDAMEPFGAGNPLNELIRNSLGNRTLIGLDGSVLRTQRGPINFVSATVPKIQDVATPERPEVPFPVCYLALDAWELPGGGALQHPGTPLTRLGIFVSPTNDLVNWTFISAPTVQSELVTQPLRCSDPNYQNRADDLGIEYQGLRLYEIYPENSTARNIVENRLFPYFYEQDYVEGASNLQERKWPMLAYNDSMAYRGSEYRSAYLGAGNLLIPFEQSYYDADITFSLPNNFVVRGNIRYRNYYQWASGCHYDLGNYSTVGCVLNGDWEFVAEGTPTPFGGGYFMGNPRMVSYPVPYISGEPLPANVNLGSYLVRISQAGLPLAEVTIASGLTPLSRDIRHKYYSNFNVRDYSVVFAFAHQLSEAHFITLGVATSRGLENHVTFTLGYDLALADVATSPEPPYERLYLLSMTAGGREMVASANPRLLVAAPSTGLPGSNVVLQ